MDWSFGLIYPQKFHKSLKETKFQNNTRTFSYLICVFYCHGTNNRVLCAAAQPLSIWPIYGAKERTEPLLGQRQQGIWNSNPRSKLPQKIRALLPWSRCRVTANNRATRTRQGEPWPVGPAGPGRASPPQLAARWSRTWASLPRWPALILHIKNSGPQIFYPSFPLDSERLLGFCWASCQWLHDECEPS